MSKKKIFISNNGCARRALDCSRLKEYFLSNKCEIVDDRDRSDHNIFVTCSFKQSKEDECYRLIEELQRCKGELIVVGCLPEIAPVTFSQKFKGKYVSTKRIDEIDQYFSDFKIKFKETPDAHQLFNSSSFQASFKNILWRKSYALEMAREHVKDAVRSIKNHLKKIPCMKRSKADKNDEYAYLRISDGCVERCAYCCIYRAVGTLRSKSIKACVKEYDKYLRKGYRRIVLLSDNLGAYGFDIESSFAALLNNLAAISAKEVHWYLQELHPRWVILYRAALLNFAEEQRIQEILCAIQSGSNRILKLMNRHHSIEEIRDVLLQLRIVNPNVKLYTQVIVGFPSETEEDFLATLMVLKEIRFDQVTLYPYYDGYDTIASKMDGKIDEITMSRRLKAGMEYLKQEKIDAWCDNADVDSANMLLLKRND